MTDTQEDPKPQVIAAAKQPVDPTGVRNLDLVLGGGLPRGALTLVVGQPGSGKTTLACQIAFAAARAGRRVLVLTALSEPVSKLLTHMRTLSFYEEELIGDRLLVLSLDQFRADGVAPTGEALVALAREERVSLVVLDGFRGVADAAIDPHGTRQFLYHVGTTLGIAGTTTVITREADLRDTSFYPEGTTADVILGLHARLDDMRQRRGLEVIKVRGAGPLSGLHGLQLGEDGAAVYPRLESWVGRSSDLPEEGRRDGASDRASFDLPEFDALLGGGLTRRTVTLVIGSPGTGKTLLGIHFALAGVRAGEPVLFLGFHETRSELQLKASAFDLGHELSSALAPAGGLTLLRHPPVELDPDALADELLSALDRTGARRLVVDSIAALERAVSETSDGRRVPNYLAALVEILLERGVTTVFTKEHSTLAAAELRLPADMVSVVASNVIWMQLVTYRERIRRVLSVPKMRYSAHDDTLREFEIATPFGIRVRTPFESTPEMLAESSGQPRTPSGAAVRPRALRGRKRR